MGTDSFRGFGDLVSLGFIGGTATTCALMCSAFGNPVKRTYSKVLILLAGFPPQNSFGGMSVFTKLHMDTTELSPMLTPDLIVLNAPIRTFFPIFSLPNLAVSCVCLKQGTLWSLMHQGLYSPMQ